MRKILSPRPNCRLTGWRPILKEPTRISALLYIFRN